MPVLIPFKNSLQQQANAFFAACLPESGRAFDPQGRHRPLTALSETYKDGGCWCLLEQDALIGTVAVKPLSPEACELKTLYIYARFQGQGYGRLLLETALDFARERGYGRIYLDTLRTSDRALKLYRTAGFRETEPYNGNAHAELFLVKELSAPEDRQK